MIERQRKILQLLDTSGPRLHRLMTRLIRREDVVGDLMQGLFLRLWNSKAPDYVTYVNVLQLARKIRDSQKKLKAL